MTSFTACLDSEKYKSQVEKDRNEASKLGFSGTPSFVIGRTKDYKLDGVKIVGALPYATFDSKIHELLTEP
jgi:predicted DsbA family dithiol-disulfide isomerase